MTTQEIIEGLQNILSYCRYHENAPALREAIRILTEMLETEDVPDTNVGNMISRQDAIDAHCELCEDRGRCNCDICPDVEVFQLLPSAQSEKRTENTRGAHACDCIDRQAAIDALMAWEEYSVWDEECLKHRGEPFWVSPSDVIKQLPSAQPERNTGEWIKVKRCEEDTQPNLKCPFCGNIVGWFDLAKYCAGCGAKLEGGAG